MLVSLSKGKIQLSDGLMKVINVKDFDRGNVKIEARTLPERVEDDLGILDLDYFIENNRVVVCTHQEAGKRWRDWWLRYAGSRVFK